MTSVEISRHVEACDAPAGAAVAQITILLTSAGRRVMLAQAFRHAARDLGVNLRLLACDMHPDLSAACRSADMRFTVPGADRSDYVDAVEAICRAERVDLIVPTIDPELMPLSEARARLLRAGAFVAVSDPAVVTMTGDKLATAWALAACGIATPTSLSLDEARADPGKIDWPVIVKPRHGSAGRGIRIAAGPADLQSGHGEPMMVQRRLVGAEWTVNMFVDQAGVLRAVVPHQRLAVRAGEVEKGMTARNPRFDEIAQRLCDNVAGLRGALCFQAMVAPDGEAAVFEINARFGGGYPLADHAGAPFARWLIEERCGLPSSACNTWRSGVTMLRYDDAVFL